METPYMFGRKDLSELQIRKHFPERPDNETPIIRAWLNHHGEEYDWIAFSVRIGQGLEPNPDHLPEIQAMTTRNTMMRIDVLAWRGQQPEIVEVKQRVTSAVLGQLLAYRQLFREENPNAPEPILTAIGHSSTPDTLRVLANHGITVLLYD